MLNVLTKCGVTRSTEQGNLHKLKGDRRVVKEGVGNDLRELKEGKVQLNIFLAKIKNKIIFLVAREIIESKRSPRILVLAAGSQ